MFDATTQTAQFVTPRDCTPRFDKTTKLKRFILKEIEREMDERHRNPPLDAVINRPILPKQVKIIIANFNVDYSRTFVLVPNEGSVEEVKWRRVSYTLEGERLYDNRFRAGPVRGDFVTEDLIRKILKHGIVRVIHPGKGS